MQRKFIAAAGLGVLTLALAQNPGFVLQTPHVDRAIEVYTGNYQTWTDLDMELDARIMSLVGQYTDKRAQNKSAFDQLREKNEPLQLAKNFNYRDDPDMFKLFAKIQTADGATEPLRDRAAYNEFVRERIRYWALYRMDEQKDVRRFKDGLEEVSSVRRSLVGERVKEWAREKKQKLVKVEEALSTEFQIDGKGIKQFLVNDDYMGATLLSPPLAKDYEYITDSVLSQFPTFSLPPMNMAK